MSGRSILWNYWSDLCHELFKLFFLFGGSCKGAVCFSGCPVYFGLWCVRSTVWLVLVHCFGFPLSFNKSVLRKKAYFLAMHLESGHSTCVNVFFLAKLITTASLLWYLYSHSFKNKNIVSPQCQLLRNFTTSSRFLYHSIAESLSPFSLLNNNKFFSLSLVVVIAPLKQIQLFLNIHITSFSIKSIPFPILLPIQLLCTIASCPNTMNVKKKIIEIQIPALNCNYKTLKSAVHALAVNVCLWVTDDTFFSLPLFVWTQCFFNNKLS